MADDTPKNSRLEFMIPTTFPSLNPKLLREVRELFELAQDVKEETVFLQEPLYKKFNTKYDGGQIFIYFLCQNFQSIGFDNVCIYWCQKFLKKRGCTAFERATALDTLLTSYFSTKNYEKVLECGHELLSLKNEKAKVFDMSMTLKMIRESTLALEKYDETEKYSRELLKLEIKFYNQGEVDKNSVLRSYLNLIDAQMKNKNYNATLKTFSRLKIFSLHSSDPNNVKAALEQDESIKKFPIFCLELDILVLPKDYYTDKGPPYKAQNVYANLKENENAIKEMILNTDLCYIVSQLVLKKGELLNVVYNRYGEKWYKLHLFLIWNIHTHLRMNNIRTLIIKGNYKDVFDIIDEFTASALRYADVNMLERMIWYSRLCFEIFLWPNIRPSYIVSRAVKKYNIPLEQVLPFINFCLKGMNDLSQEDRGEILSVKEQMLLFMNSPLKGIIDACREEMLSLKNSLIIMNHFNKTS